MACAPSARLEATLPEQESSFALEGTIAHAVAEHLLKRLLSAGAQFVPPIDQIRSQIQDEASSSIMDLVLQCTDNGFDFWEIFETVYTYYVTPVYEDYLLAKECDPEALLIVEAELELKSFIPEGFGSSDAVIIFLNELKVYDLKYGQGVKVDATQNTQMMCYALGACLGPAELYNIDFVSMTIIQPRLRHISNFRMLYGELMWWGSQVLRPAARKAFDGEGAYVAGDHCKFCKAAPKCRALAAHSAATAQVYGKPEQLSPAEMGEVLRQVEEIENWCGKVKAYALERAMDGTTIPGWKVVEGRSVSKIADQAAAIKALTDAGFSTDVVCKPQELKGVTDLKKILRAKGFDELLGKYVVKPAGKPTLAPAEDSRPAMSDAASDFANI